MIGAAAGKSKMRAVLVQAWKPAPISASLAPVRARTMEVLPLCTLPISHTSGASRRASSETIAGVIAASAGSAVTGPLGLVRAAWGWNGYLPRAILAQTSIRPPRVRPAHLRQAPPEGVA